MSDKEVGPVQKNRKTSKTESSKSRDAYRSFIKKKAREGGGRGGRRKGKAERPERQAKFRTSLKIIEGHGLCTFKLETERLLGRRKSERKGTKSQQVTKRLRITPW